MNNANSTEVLCISPTGQLGKACIELKLNTFDEACSYIAKLPYRRNFHRDQVTGVLIDGCGTCSTKHRFLAALALEQAQQESNKINAGWKDIQLRIGVFEMHANNTPAIAPVLHAAQLNAIPEAHCYLAINDMRCDFTSDKFTIPFQDTLLYETHVDPINLFLMKDSIHKRILEQWAINHAPDFSIERLWEIREACIGALSKEP